MTKPRTSRLLCQQIGKQLFGRCLSKPVFRSGSVLINPNSSQRIQSKMDRKDSFMCNSMPLAQPNGFANTFMAYFTHEVLKSLWLYIWLSYMLREWYIWVSRICKKKSITKKNNLEDKISTHCGVKRWAKRNHGMVLKGLLGEEELVGKHDL